MKAFNHVNATTIDEAIEVLRQGKGLSTPIAGGTDLLGILKDRVLPSYPETILNLKTIRDLNYIREDAEGLKIGALAKLSDIDESPIVRKRCKLLADAAHSVATPQIRNLATIGGNLIQDVRCWYYRYPHQIGGRILCARKRGDRPGILAGEALGSEESKGCSALMGDNRYHSIFGAAKVSETPCSEDCPAGVEIPLYLSRIRERDLNGAARVLLGANPLPAVTGRVCPQSCRERCNRGDWDTPVSTRNIERFMGDFILENFREFMKPPETVSGKQVAVVGSGPAGLSAAFYLRSSGHHVVVFDRMKEPGGMLLHAIPSFRLPREIVRRLVDSLEGMGIEFRSDTEVGKDVTLEELRKKFDRVFLATGAWGLPSLGLEGEGLTRGGLEFLMGAKQGIREASGKRVLVIGGGNVAMDAAVTALRQGALEVVVACLESRETMPAQEPEIEKAVSEGVSLMPSWGPSRVLESGGNVKGMELLRCVSVFDKDGSFSPCFDHAVQKNIETDLIILAVGQLPDLAFIGQESTVLVHAGLVRVDGTSQQTALPGVFAGGDLTTGPSSVVRALAAGRRAAFAINRSLRGTERPIEEKRSNGPGGLLAFKSDCLRPVTPMSAPERPPEERNLDQEDALGLNAGEVQREADRCLNCGCVAVGASDIAPVLVALDATITTTKRTIPAGIFFSATESGSRPLAHDELITEISIPDLPRGARCGYKKFRTRNSVDFPIVSLATVFGMDAGTFKVARIVLGAVAPFPVRETAVEEFLKGKSIREEVAEQAAALAVENALPLSGNAYKIQIVKTLVKRSIMGAGSEETTS